jgi:hypothetical protein
MRVDGASAVQVYLRIYLPLMTPALAIVSIYALLLAWNDYLYSEARPRILVEGPALWALIADGLGPVQRSLAFAPVKATEMPAAERHPHHTLAVDVGTARAKARQWGVVDLGKRRRGRVRARI